MTQQLLNYENARNDEYVLSFVNRLRNELPAGYRLSVTPGNDEIRPQIFIRVAYGGEISESTPIFQIDRNYNLYNINTAMDNIDFSVDITQSNGANIQTMNIDPQSDAATNGWNSVMDHVNYERDVEHLDEDLHSMMNNDDVQYNLGDRFVNGKKLT